VFEARGDKHRARVSMYESGNPTKPSEGLWVRQNQRAMTGTWEKLPDASTIQPPVRYTLLEPVSECHEAARRSL
jgi:hypothetical protein